VAGTYNAAQNVVLTSATTDAAIYYTTNGSTPTAASTKYSSAISVTSSETIKAIAVSPTFGSSTVESAAYVIQGSTAQASFTLTGSSPSAVVAGGSASAVITIIPTGGFTGSVALACAVTSSPSGAVHPPTCAVTPTVVISGTQPMTSKLTINTTAGKTAALHNPLQRLLPLGEGTLVALLFFWLPLRRRKSQSLLGLLVFVTLAAASSGCGSTKITSPDVGGTTAGAYTITVTGTSGSIKASTTINISVQ
jgi:hypothetical protein